MSFSSQILTFLGVASIYIGFTFVWAWYKGRQETEEETETQPSQPDPSVDHRGEH